MIYFSGHLTDLEYAVLTQWFDYAIKQYKVKIDLVGEYFGVFVVFFGGGGMKQAVQK